jgi:glycosyltransferase involved in cell wall biosynthesis
MGARIIWTVHNLEPHDAIKKKEYQIIMDYLHSVLDGWISQSDPATKLILNKYPNLSNISHSKIPHGHFRNAFPQTSKTKKESLFQLGLPEHSTILLSLGRIEPYKGLVNLAKIFCEINDPNTFLVIAGPGKGTTIEQLKFIALKNKNIRIFNYQIRDEMSIFFRAADLSILPYKAILNSSSAILSLSFNRPLIAPALGSLVELQNQYGREWLRLYHEEINLSILKKEIEKIKNYPIEEKILNLDDIDWKNVAEKTSNFLDKIN